MIPNFMEWNVYLDLSPTGLNICEIISKDFGVDVVVEALKPLYARYRAKLVSQMERKIQPLKASSGNSPY